MESAFHARDCANLRDYLSSAVAEGATLRDGIFLNHDRLNRIIDYDRNDSRFRSRYGYSLVRIDDRVRGLFDERPTPVPLGRDASW